MVSALFFSYDTTTTYSYLWIHLLFLAIIAWTPFYATSSLLNRNEEAYKFFCIMRVTIEVLKLLFTITIMMGVNGGFKYSEELKLKYGNLRFSMLFQELLSISLFIPVLTLGRYIFKGFTNYRFYNAF